MRKKHKLLVITPSGEEIKLGYLSPVADGFVLGVPKIEGTETSHLTVLNKKRVLSSHITPQDKPEEKPRYFPKFNFRDLSKELQKRAGQNFLSPVPTNKLSEIVFYITEKFGNWLDSVQTALYEKRTSKKEVIHVINFKNVVEKIPKLVEELKQSPSSFFGICKAKEILEDSSKIFGFTDSKLVIIPFENQLYYLNFSSLLNLNPELEQKEISNPLSEIYRSMGFGQYMQEVKEKKILDKLLSKDLEPIEIHDK